MGGKKIIVEEQKKVVVEFDSYVHISINGKNYMGNKFEVSPEIAKELKRIAFESYAVTTKN